MPATHRRTRTRRHTRRRRYALCAAAAAAGLGIVAAAFAWQAPTGKPPTRADAAYCGLVACAALQPGITAPTTTPVTPAASAPVTGLPSGGGQVKPQTSPDPAASTSSAAPVPAPTVAPPATTTSPPGPSPTSPPTSPPAPPATTPPPITPSPTPTSADVTATYSTPRQWRGGFLGELTIVNQDGPAVTGWQIAITLPGDQVQRVWNANWQPAGDGSVIMTPMPGDQVIEPGDSLTVSFIVQGDTTEPSDCTFNGSPCS
jgi:Cellulose binding domain